MFSESLEPRSGNWAEEPGWGTGSNSANSSLLHLGANEILFETGDPRTCLYRVELGAVVLHEQRWNGHHGVIDFAFPGDLVGLGLPRYSFLLRSCRHRHLSHVPARRGTIASSRWRRKGSGEAGRGNRKRFRVSPLGCSGFQAAFVSQSRGGVPCLHVAHQRAGRSRSTGGGGFPARPNLSQSCSV